ncbi:MAG: glycosyltransferase family 4 protein [Bacteroidales bacterium]|nr:glycosyltransferase family 4 protein [Bacteroidales bacterium]
MNKTSKDKKILYFYAVRMSFVARDIEIMKRRYPLTEYYLDTKKKWKIPLRLFHQFIFLLAHIRSAKTIICFFAGYHSLLPALFGRIFSKPVLIFLGGADAYRYPSFNYGHFNKFLIGKFTCLSARLADLLIPVDDSLMYSESDYYDAEYAKQGIRHFCRDLKTPSQTISLEYDPDLFYRKSENVAGNTFITAGFGIEGSSFVRKGIDIIIEVAKLLPDCEFTVLGCSPDVIKVPFTANVKFIPPVPYEKLAGIYSQNRFYLQLSIAEGFPSAICEAMLCECIPIGSKVAAIPLIVGDTGFILEKRDVNQLKGIIEIALAREDLPELGRKARQRISEKFHPGARSEKIYEILS